MNTKTGQYNTTQYKNLIAHYNLVIVQQLCTVCKVCIINYYILLCLKLCIHI